MSTNPWSIKIVARTALCWGLLGLAASPSLALHPPPEATVKASKGPVQITLRLYKTKVKANKSLWYQIEMKNIGKEKIEVLDKVFRDPWAMHSNTFYRVGIYIEVHGPDEKHSRQPMGRYPYRRGIGERQVDYDYIHKPMPPEEAKAVEKEVVGLEAQWKKQGLSDVQRTLKLQDWNRDRNDRKKMEEDIAKLLWLKPNASTATFAWAYPCDDPDLCISPEEAKAAGIDWKDIVEFKDDAGVEKQVGDYTQLWSYQFDKPGKYKLRAVYKYGLDATDLERHREYHLRDEPWEVDIASPYIAFEVTP